MEDIELKIQAIYNQHISHLNEVLETFQDYFNKDNVDIQYMEYSLFKENLLHCDLGDSFNLPKYVNTYLWTLNNQEHKELLLKILNFILENKKIIVNTKIYTYINNIIIYFPKIKVTNEYNIFTYIYDTYVQVRIGFDKCLYGTFNLLRTSYTYAQYNCGYIHSHVPSLYHSSDIYNWKTPCLGEGPIRDTIMSLIHNYNTNILKLFCAELEIYLQTESIIGVPYIRLSTVNNTKTNSTYSTFSHLAVNKQLKEYSKDKNIQDLIFNFITYFISKNILKFRVIDNKVTINSSIIDFYILIGNSFIEYYNSLPKREYTVDDLISLNIISLGTLKDNNILFKNLLNNIENFPIKKILTFKNKDKYLKILNIQDDVQYSIFLNPILSNFILLEILTFINCNLND